MAASVLSTGLLQGHDVKDSTSVPAPYSPADLPEKLDVRKICVGIPKVSDWFETIRVGRTALSHFFFRKEMWGPG